MAADGTTCPRCLQVLSRKESAEFCPRCGLKLATQRDDERVRLDTPIGKVEISTSLAFGSICNLYRCSFETGQPGGVFKIARVPQINRHVEHEFKVLTHLHGSTHGSRLAPFLPRSEALVNYAYPDEPSRSGVVLRYHAGIEGADDLYSLEEVRGAYPAGIDARDMAWIWRRLLTVLGYVHACQHVHGQVTPDHVMIDPRDHKLVLIGWCAAVPFGAAQWLRNGNWSGWPGDHWQNQASPAVDLAAGSRSMSYLLGPSVDPAIARHLERATDTATDAFKLLDDFDRLIEALWGPRSFREFKMPARVMGRGAR